MVCVRHTVQCVSRASLAISAAGGLIAMASFSQDGPEAHRIASVIPYYPFHGNFDNFFYRVFI